MHFQKRSKQLVHAIDSTYEATTDVYYSSMGSVGLAVVVIGGLIARYRCKRRIITTEGDQVLDNELLS